MKVEHRQILDKIEEYLKQPGSEHLRFWQALFNIDVISPSDVANPYGVFLIKDDYNIDDKKLLNKIKF